jgi:hypothetical protein
MKSWRRWKNDPSSRRCVIDLGELDPLRYAQYQQWHELCLAGPTRSVVGTSSNDFPGLYYYDPRDRLQHVLMFEGDIDWRSCTLDRRVVQVDDGSFHLMVGLFSDSNVDGSTKLHSTKVKRELGVGQLAEDRDAMPDQWEALGLLMRESFSLLPLPQAGEPSDWEAIAETCLSTLLKRGFKREIAERKFLLFYETFVSDQSTYALKPDSEFKGTAELICQAGLASALLGYSSSDPKKLRKYRDLGIQLVDTLRYFYDGSLGVFHNTFPPRGEEWARAVFDTWYGFHNLYHVLKAANLAGDEELQQLTHSALDRMISFVRACNYQIPLFAKISNADKRGGPDDAALIGIATNPSVLGMYAMLLVEAATIFPQAADEYRDEAMTALRNLHRWPLTQMFHQTVQLSWAAWAAHRLGESAWRDDFTRCLLMSCYRQGPNAGLFQGCSGLMYPAFRETVEAITPWVEFHNEAPMLPLRKILRLVLEKANRFLRDGLPQEGLASREQPKASNIGIAIYATPQIFELAGACKAYQM